MERQKALDKLTILFTSFLGDKRNRIRTDGGELLSNQAMVRTSDGDYRWKCYRHDREFFVNGNFQDQSDIDYANLYANGNHNFSRGKLLNTSYRKVEIKFNDKPSLVLYEIINSQEKSTTLYHITWKNFFRRVFMSSESLTMIEYELKATRTFTFGSIIVELTQEEFNNLFTIAKAFAEVRPNELDEAILDERLLSYNGTY